VISHWYQRKYVIRSIYLIVQYNLVSCISKAIFADTEGVNAHYSWAFFKLVTHHQRRTSVILRFYLKEGPVQGILSAILRSFFYVKLIRYQFWYTRCAFRLRKSFQWYLGRKSWKSEKKKCENCIKADNKTQIIIVPWNWAKSVEG
jgi:hypothetical protein